MYLVEDNLKKETMKSNYTWTFDEPLLQKMISLKQEEIKIKQRELEVLNDKLQIIEDIKLEEMRKKNQKMYADQLENRKQNITDQIEYENTILNTIREEDMEDSNTPAKVLRAWIKNEDDDEDFDEDDTSNIIHINQLNIESEPKFGDMLDFTGYRHYSIKFVGKDGSVISNNYCTGLDDNIECGLQVPADICRYLKDPWKKYQSNIDECIGAFELPVNSKIVKGYKNVPENCLYTYLRNWDMGDWELTATDKNSQEVVLKK